jgi:transposase
MSKYTIESCKDDTVHWLEDRQLLSQWVVKSGLALKPLYEEMKRLILNSENVFMWVLCGGGQRDPPYRVYNFRENRQHRHAEDFLKGFQGIVHSDKYGAYETLAHKKLFTWCPCWAHIRRKFFEAEHGDKAFREMVLSKINELFLMEQAVWEKTPEERLKIRREEAVPIINSLTLAVKGKLTEGKVLRKKFFILFLLYRDDQTLVYGKVAE